MPEFAHRWFERGPQEIWERHVLPLTSEVDTYLEIGSADGESMWWVLNNLKPSKAMTIDPWEANCKRLKRREFRGYRARYHANLKRWLDDGTLTVFDGTSFDVLRDRHKEIPDESVDLCYVDGAHRAWDTMGDLILVWPKIKFGGVVIVDDLQRRWLNGKPLVRPAYFAFQIVYDSRYEWVFCEPRQAAFRKVR